MAATFNYAARYEISGICEIPLRTSGADGDTETVLRGSDGCAFIQGASLTGALRSWLTQRDAGMTETLFGSQKQAGQLILSDAVFDAGVQQELRPRLRINGATASADKGGKFDIAHIAKGSQFTFQAVWLGKELDQPALDAIEGMLGALNSGDIRLGAQKSNGFGRVSLNVQRRIFSMKNAADRAAWLQDEPGGEPIAIPSPHSSAKTVFTLTGSVDSILVKASAQEQSQDGSVIRNLTEGGTPILPGSSVKGAVRARAESIARICGVSQETVDNIFGRNANNADHGKPGRVFFEDMTLSGKQREITRIRINRFTGGVMRGGLFKEGPMDSNVTLRMTVPANDPVACALVLYALRDLGLGLYNLGSGGSLGRGFIKVNRIRAETPDGRKAALSYASGQFTADDSSGLFQEWLNALGGKNCEN